MELKKALDEPDPHRFVSHLQIHQDGTCNGLQHYAALGGDIAGAKQVNLEPGNRPSDVYTGVAEMVKAEIAEMAAGGTELAQHLDGKLTRKVVKQTVMTNVYGVTFMGAKAQVRKQLEDLFPDFPNTFSVNYERAARLITKLTFGALSSMFHGAHAIQHWFGDCAAAISQAVSPQQIQSFQDQADGKVDSSSQFSKSGNLKKQPWTESDLYRTSIIWTTPLKMPVVQPYRKFTSQKVDTHMQRFTLARSSSSSDPVSKTQQRRAFPPNFIHSLDATHMILTALKCNEIGLTFAAVHDSFWTHAGDVDIMNRIIRDAFIRMHSEDIMGRLRAEFSARYKGHLYLASVDRSSAVAQKISRWRKEARRKPKSVKSGKLSELLMEYRRLKLLASKKPEERLEGESLITAGRIFEDMANEKDLIPAPDVERLGQLPRSIADQGVDVGDVDIEEPFEPLISNAVPSVVVTDDTEDRILIEEERQIEGDNRDEIDPGGVEDDANDACEKVEERKETPAKRRGRSVWLWLPMTFPPIPEKVC